MGNRPKSLIYRETSEIKIHPDPKKRSSQPNILSKSRHSYRTRQAFLIDSMTSSPVVRVLMQAELGDTVTRTLYAAAANAWADFQLLAMCLTPKTGHREINQSDRDDLIEAHPQRMATPETKQKYAARSSRDERPFV